jgi:hypothetical protein
LISETTIVKLIEVSWFIRAEEDGMTVLRSQDVETDTILGKAAKALQVSEEDVLRQGIRALLERRLRDIKAQIFELTGCYEISSVEEMEEQYRDGTLEEADSWRDLQHLDHLEYKRDRLQELIEMLP